MSAKENIVYIRRKRSKTDGNADLKLMNDNASKYMGSAGYKGSELPITGLTEVEKFAIMPSLVAVSNQHPEFDMKVNDYFHNLRVEVKAGKGLRLNITTEEKEITYAGKKQTVEFPKNALDYVLYKRAICPDYKQCASDIDHTSGDRVKFYVHDVEKFAKLEEKLGDARDEAYDAFLKLTEKPEENWNNILILYGFDPDVLSKRDKKARLRLLAVGDGVKGMDEQEKHFNLFIERVGDKKIELKAFLSKAVKAGIIVNQNTSYIYSNDAGSVTIGRSEDEAIAWLENLDNSKDKLVIEAKLNK